MLDSIDLVSLTKLVRSNLVGFTADVVTCGFSRLLMNLLILLLKMPNDDDTFDTSDLKLDTPVISPYKLSFRDFADAAAALNSF